MTFMTPAAIQHLERSDRVLRRVIRQIGPCKLEPVFKRSPFESLVRAVAHQQLHATAANSILDRFIALFPGKRFPKPEHVLGISELRLREAGFSQAKVLCIRDVAAKTLEGVVPTTAKIRRLDDIEIIERLTQARGVGRWTAEMLLIFQLGRPDVLPVDDFGLRNGFRVAYKLDKMPTARELRDYGARWAPHRTTASWYLWRVADASRKPPQI
jgi:DNA-3-methyladenine glycosylase II